MSSLNFQKVFIEHLLSPGTEIRNILMEGARDLKVGLCVSVADEGASPGNPGVKWVPP